MHYGTPISDKKNIFHKTFFKTTINVDYEDLCLNQCYDVTSDRTVFSTLTRPYLKFFIENNCTPHGRRQGGSAAVPILSVVRHAAPIKSEDEILRKCLKKEMKFVLKTPLNA